MRVLAIARNTFRENIRDKVLYNLVLFALLMIVSSLALGQLTLGHTDKVIVDLGLSSISMIGTLIAIFIGISLVSWDLLSPARWVGLENYRTLWGDHEFRSALVHTLLFIAGYLPLVLIGGLGDAATA